MLKGIAASSGIAIKPVYKLVKPTLVVDEVSKGAQIEKEVLASAVEKTRLDITLIKEKAIGRLSDDELAIFDAHLLVLDDPELVGQIEMLIDEGKSVSSAIDTVKTMFVSMFEGLDDPYFKERAADIKDVTYRLMAHSLGVNLPNLSLIDHQVVIVAHDLTPSDTAQLDRNFVLGFATEIGGRTSHSAIMARSLEIPAVVGIKGILESCETDDLLVLDALEGKVFINPSEEVVKEYEQKLEDYKEYVESLKLLKGLKSETLDGHHVELSGNIGSVEDALSVDNNDGDGIGLYRTEFLYMNNTSLPSEEDQFEAYKQVLQTMKDKLVVIRTLDIGGDKHLPYFELPTEMNPFLGQRALRLCLANESIFRTQLRALLRASSFGKLAIMFPMVATLEEFRAAKKILLEEKEVLVSEGISVSDDLQVGIMIEIPAAAVNARNLAKEADFFSIGTNDLIQYSMASDRMNETVSYLYQPYHPSILNLVKLAIDGAHSAGKWCGMCGEMAGEPLAIPLLLGLGLDEFSMSASSILSARKLVRSLKYEEMKELANKAIELSTQEEVLELLKSKVQL